MKKIVFGVLIIISLCMTSCNLLKFYSFGDYELYTGNRDMDLALKSHENTFVINDEKAVVFTDLDKQQVYMILNRVDSAANNNPINSYYYTDKEGIKEISGNAQLRKFFVDNTVYYYNAFHYHDNILILIYDSDTGAIGAFYYHNFIDSGVLKKCTTLKDVLDLDSSFNDEISNRVVNAMNNTFELNLDCDNSTMQVASDGVYAIKYTFPISDGEPYRNKVESIEKINNKVINIIFQMLQDL